MLRGMLSLRDFAHPGRQRSRSRTAASGRLAKFALAPAETRCHWTRAWTCEAGRDQPRCRHQHVRSRRGRRVRDARAARRRRRRSVDENGADGVAAVHRPDDGDDAAQPAALTADLKLHYGPAKPLLAGCRRHRCAGPAHHRQHAAGRFRQLAKPRSEGLLLPATAGAPGDRQYFGAQALLARDHRGRLDHERAARAGRGQAGC
jgi:hypothetical protein